MAFNKTKHDMTKIAKQLLSFAEEALELGFNCISDGDHSPFVLMATAEDERHLVNLESASGTIDAELVDVGRHLIRDFDEGQMYALVWDGYLTTDGTKSDAVFAEVGKRGGTKAFVFAQKYKQKKRSRTLSLDGPTFAVQEAKHLWKTGHES